MIPPTLGRAILVGRLVHITNLHGTYDSKTDQTDQTDQHIEIAEELSTPFRPNLTSPHPKLTSGTAQRSNPDVQVAGARIDSTHAPSSYAGPRP